MPKSLNRQHLLDTLLSIRQRTSLVPRIGLVLGSGLGDLADRFPDAVVIDTASLPYYPRGSVEGHKGRLIFAVWNSVPVLAFQGRVHFYESNDLNAVLFPVYVARELGAEVLIVTNAAGGINRRFAPGDLMLITDQLNLTSVRSPAKIDPVNRHNPLFDRQLMSLISAIAHEGGITLRRGIYAGVKGPSYETAAEVEMINRLGGDAVGMSTVLETSLAASLGMRVAGISCITNKATGIGEAKLNHEEVTLAAEHARSDFTRLLLSVIERL
jgi:purine-nucleoside phosphorylase